MTARSWSDHGAHHDAVGAAPEALSEALRLRMPNTKIVAGNYPVRGVWFTIGKGAHCAEFCVSVEDIGADREFDDAVEAAIAIVHKRIDVWTSPPPAPYAPSSHRERIRAWVGLPDMPPFVRERALDVLREDRVSLSRARDEVVRLRGMVVQTEEAFIKFGWELP